MYSVNKRIWHMPHKYAFIKKSAILVQFFWDLVKTTTSFVGHFDQVSKKLGQNCGFFNKSIFVVHVSNSLVHTVYFIFTKYYFYEGNNSVYIEKKNLKLNQGNHFWFLKCTQFELTCAQECVQFFWQKV